MSADDRPEKVAEDSDMKFRLTWTQWNKNNKMMIHRVVSSKISSKHLHKLGFGMRKRNSLLVVNNVL